MQRNSHLPRFSLWMIVAVGLLVRANATEADPPGAGSPAAAELAAAEDQLFQARIDKNMDVIARGFADEGLYVHVPGLTQTKAEYLEMFRNSRIAYRSIDTEGRIVRVFGEVGITRAKIIQTIGEQSRANAYLAVYIKRDGRWQLLEWRTSPIPAANDGERSAPQK